MFVLQGAGLGHLDIALAQQLQQPASGACSTPSYSADTAGPLSSSLSMTQLDDAQSSNRER